jgi:UV DNA damage endonuclease
MHPGQYTVLNSLDNNVSQRAAADLLYHCEVLDAFGCDATCKIVLHIGGVYSDKREAIDRFIRNYSLLEKNIKSRLVIENDDRAYNVEDALYVSGQTGMPVVFDYLHHELNSPKSDLSPFDWIDECSNTWEKKDGRQKIHYSQSDTNFAAGAHSKHIRAKEFVCFYNDLYHKDVDLMLEVKDKNLSAVKCILLTKSGLRAAELEREWARYKYFILSRSAALYNKIRSVLKNKSHPDAALFYGFIDEALYLPEDKGAEVNAAQHVWGYISKESSVKEAERFFTLLSQYQHGEKQRDAIKNFLHRAAKRQNITYLLESLYFYL